MKRFMNLTMAVAMSLSMMVCGFGSSIEAKEKKQEETTNGEVINLYGSKKVQLGELEYGVNSDFILDFDEDDDSLTEHNFYLNGEYPLLSIDDIGVASDEEYENFDTVCDEIFESVAEEFYLEDYSYDIEYKQIKKEKVYELECTLSTENVKDLIGQYYELEGDLEYSLEMILCPNKQVYMITFIKEAADKNKYDLDDFVKSIDFSKFETDSSKNTKSNKSSNESDTYEFDDSSIDC